ncbi:MAG: hypothetical protein ABI867_33980 [Kofleriaceae bacterium]
MKVRALAIVLALISVPAAADKLAPVQQPAVQVTCDLIEIWGSHGKGGMDAAIGKSLASRLTSTLKQTEFKQLSTQSKTIEKKKPTTVKLGKGSATVNLIETVDRSQARITVDFTAAKGIKTSAQQLVSGNDWIVVAANQSKDPNPDAHILAVSCK